MALHTVHLAFDHWMMLRKAELRMRFNVALKAWPGVLPWIHDELSSASPGGNMLAARPMTGFAAGLSHQRRALEMDARVRAGREHSCDVRMAVIAGSVADER